MMEMKIHKLFLLFSNFVKLAQIFFQFKMDFFILFLSCSLLEMEKKNLKLGNKSKELNDEFHYAYTAIVYFEMLSLARQQKINFITHKVVKFDFHKFLTLLKI